MTYVAIDNHQSVQGCDWFAIGDLIDLCRGYPEHKVYFIGTNYSPQSLISWRGSYCEPAILASNSVLNGNEVASKIEKELQETHYGYKGGEYTYYEGDVFRVVLCKSSSAYHSVDGYKVVGDCLYLNTNINEY